MKKIIGIVIIIAIIVSAVKLFKTRQASLAGATPPPPPTLTLSLVKARQGEATKSERFLAKLESQREVKITTKLSGYIQNIAISQSQYVNKGDLLVKIDEGELLSTIKSLKVTKKQQQDDYDLTLKIYNRNKKLTKAGALSQEKLDLSKLTLQGKLTQVINTKKKIKQLYIQLEYLAIKAPFDGMIGDILLKEGSLASPNQTILTMSQDAQKITFSFSPEDQTIKKGQSVLLDGDIIGSVKTIYTKALNGLSVAEVALTRKMILPEGSSLSIEVVTGKEKGCIIPIDTLIYGKESTKVMEYNGGRFTATELKVLHENTKEALVTPCPKDKIAQGSEAKLTKLGFYREVKIRDFDE
jgi:RND family efflux transporter MFP subunit